MATKQKLPKDYENNPFFIATKGLTLFFDLARGLAFLLVALSVLNLFSGDWNTESGADNPVDAFTQIFSGWSVNDWLVAGFATLIIGMAAILLFALFGGVSAYASARIARGHKVSLGEAFRVAFDNLWAFLWLQIIISVKTFLWFLLLIIPGIIMSVRYSLAGVAFFDKDLRGNTAIKESLRLTHGAWLTTFAASSLFNMITLGVISWVTSVGTNAVLYHQFDKLGDKKPDAHWLSWFTLVLPFILFFLFIGIVIVAVGTFIAINGGNFSE